MPRLLQAFLPSGELNPDAIGEASELLLAGRLVAIPTETVYGLAANALDAAAVRRIFEAKGRPVFNPLIVHVASIDAARELASEWPNDAQRLAAAFWPGPLSIIVKKRPLVPAEVSAGQDTVALRWPSHPITQALLTRCGFPLAAPSANRSNGVSPTTAAHVVASLGDRVDAVLDGGPCRFGIESTVVDVTGPAAIVRPGAISISQLEAAVGPIAVQQSPKSGPLHSPGQLARHYSPDAETLLFDSRDLATTLASLPSTARVGGLVRDVARPGDSRIVAWGALGNDATKFAHDLYAALHRLDDAGLTHVLLERAPDSAEWDAVRDRLTRAGGPRE